MLNFVCGERCFRLESPDGEKTICTGVEELCSSQEEADTKIILHCMHIASHSPDETSIVIRSPDTDVFILLLHFSQHLNQKILFDTGSGNKRRLINVKKVVENVGDKLSHALPALHSFSGCDTTSAFVRKGKIVALRTLRRNEEYLDVFLSLGKTLELTESVLTKLEEFVCKLYGKSNMKDINSLRYSKFLERFRAKPGMLLSTYNGIYMSLLPPCRDCLKMHIKRVNYQALIKADQAVHDVPSPSGHGWQIENDKLELKWTDNELMLQELVDVLVDAE